MAFNGSGVFNLVSGNPVVTGTTISSTWANNTLSDVATGLSNCVTRDGQSPATANLPMGGYKLTGVALATATGDALSYGRAATVTDFTSSGTVTLSGGTANGVAYLNASKQVTTGSALVFDGATLTATTTSGIPLVVTGTGSAGARIVGGTGVGAGAYINLQAQGGNAGLIGTEAAILGSGTSTNLMLYGYGSNSIVFAPATVEGMRLTSTGLGIGTTNPGAKLQVLGTSGAVIDAAGSGAAGLANLLSLRTGTGNTYGFQIKGNYTTEDYLIQNYYSGYLAFGTSNTERMRIDSSGNLGLGVTPSAWSGIKAVQVNNASLAGWSSDNSAMYLGANNYFDGTNFRYISTAAANQYRQQAGVHYWFTAPSGTAGNAISFTQAMTLDASGNLLVGTTSTTLGQTGIVMQPAIGGQVAYMTLGHANGTSSGNGYLGFGYNGSLIGTITQNGTTGVLYNITSDYRLKDVLGAVTGHGERIDALEPVEYNWKGDGSRARGFIAHKFQEVYPNSVTGEKDAVDEDGKPVYQTMQSSTSEVIADLVAEIQSLRKRITTLEAK